MNNGAVSALRGYGDNAGKARTKGVEWDTSWRPGDQFNVYLNGAYTDAKYLRFANAPCPPELSGGGTGMPIGASGAPGANSPATCDISGAPLPGLSKWSLSYGGEFNQPVGTLFGKDAQVYVGVDGNFRQGPVLITRTWTFGTDHDRRRATLRGSQKTRRAERGAGFFCFQKQAAYSPNTRAKIVSTALKW